MPQPSFGAQVLGGLSGTFGQVTQVQIDLHRADAWQVLDGAPTVKDSPVVWSDDLNVGAALVAPKSNGVRGDARVAGNVDANEAKASEGIERPGGWQAGEGMIDTCDLKVCVQFLG